MPSPAGAKICIRCKQDCSSRPRTKDAQGRYLCRPCQDSIAAKPADPVPIADEAMPIGLLDDAAPVAVGLQTCPSCGSSIPHGGALCVQCGFDVRKGAKLATSQGLPDEASPIPPRQGKCGKCGYSLAGLKQPRCPECGTVVGRMSDKERRRVENKQTVRWSYLKPLIQIGVGMGGAALYYTAIREPNLVLVHAVKYAIQLPFAELVFIACCFLWIGFDSSLHLILLRVAGVQALVGLVAIVAGLLPFGFMVGGVITLIAYIGIMSESLELDFQDAVLVGIATYGAQIIIGLLIIGWIIAHM